jgi:hypothetical protein
MSGDTEGDRRLNGAMAIHVGEQMLDSRRPRAVPLEGLAGALGWELKPLDDDRFGLCPEPDRCVPIPENAVAGGELLLDHDEAVAALGLISVNDRDHTVVELTDTPASGLGTGDLVDLRLPDASSGDLRPLVEPGRRTAIYAWASW